MKNVYKLSLVAVLSSLVIVGCGSLEETFGDDEGNTPDVPFTGQFVDTFVKGLNYTCRGYVDGVADQITNSGVTNEKGEFTCNNKGALVIFSIGNYIIGGYQNSGYSEDLAPTVTPYDLYNGSNEVSINLAQLLQTIDDGSTEGALTIPANFTALNDVTIKLDDADFDALMADALPNATVLVSEEVAQAHLDESLGRNFDPETPADTEALDTFVSGKSVTFSAGEESMTATFAEDGYYEENSSEHFCNGTWNVTSSTTIQVTCDDTTTFEFIEELQTGMTVYHSEAGELTITNIQTAVNPDA